MTKKNMLSIIAAIGKNRELGKDNHLLWDLPGDLHRFRSLTKNHVVIMGRKTFDSIGYPLPNRDNIVITRDPSWKREGVAAVAFSFLEARQKAALLVAAHHRKEEIFVIGGESIYMQAISFADRLYLTVVDAKADADKKFPDYSGFTKVIEKIPQEEHGIKYTYLTLEK